jgi:hypothetical protein
MLKNFMPVNLKLFDEGAGTAAGSAVGEAGGASAGSSTGSQSTASGNQGGKTVVMYGKQPENTEPGTQTGDQTGTKLEGQTAPAQLTPEQRAQEYKRLRTEYKDMFDADTQNIINKRFRETKTLESNVAAMNPIMDVLYERYGTTDLNVLASKVRADSLESLAEAANMTPEQYEETMNLRSENRQLKQKQANDEAEAQMNAKVATWWEQAAKLTGTPEAPGPYPTFDLKNEIQNDEFLSLLNSGVTVKAAYEVSHMQEILANTAASVAKKTEEGVVENIKARGNRPNEAAAKGGSQGVIIKTDVTKFTKEDRAEIARRVARGENIEL